LSKVLEQFSEAGYGLTHGVFDASLMNVPQKRKRYFVIGELDGQNDGLRELIKKSMAKESLTVREYLGNKLKTDFYYMHPRSYARRAVFSVDEPSATIRGVNRPIPQTYKFHNADAAKSFDKIRALNSVERGLLQTFPEDFVFVFGGNRCGCLDAAQTCRAHFRPARVFSGPKHDPTRGACYGRVCDT
jgi:DNA (cytosine-5)-methyltransferase 1